MTSLRNHPSFQFLIQKCFPQEFGTFSFIRKVYIGHFYNQFGWNLKMEIEECGRDDEENDNLVFMFYCFRENDMYDIGTKKIYEFKWTVPFDYEYIMKHVDGQLKDFMKKVNDISQCLHCGHYIHSEITIDNKCFSCAMQNIYDDANSDKRCSICLDPIGFGNIKKCKNNHFMHTFCFVKYNLETNKDLCPLRCGSIIE